MDIENVFWYAQGRYQRTGRCTMKKRISLICLLAAVLAAVVFCALWQSAAQDRSALRALAQSGTAEAYAPLFGLSGKGVRQRLLGRRGRIPRLLAGVHEPDGRNRQGREPPALQRGLWRPAHHAGAGARASAGNSGRHAPARRRCHGRKRIRASGRAEQRTGRIRNRGHMTFQVICPL